MPRDYTPLRGKLFEAWSQKGNVSDNTGATIAGDIVKGAQDRATHGFKMNQAEQAMMDATGTDNLEDAAKKLSNNGSSGYGLSETGFHNLSDQTLRIQNHNLNQDQANKNNARKQYDAALPHLMDQVGEFTQGMNIGGNPKNTMTLGAMRALALKAYGLNRFNEAEGNANISNSAQTMLGKIANWTGDDKELVTDAQRRDFMDLMGVGLRNTHDKHNVLRNQAVATYANTPYANETSINGFRGSMGQDFDAKIAPLMNANPGGTGLAALGIGTQQAPQAAPNQGVDTAQKAPPKPGMWSNIFGGQAADAAPPAQPPKPKVSVVRSKSTGKYYQKNPDGSLGNEVPPPPMGQ